VATIDSGNSFCACASSVSVLYRCLSSTMLFLRNTNSNTSEANDASTRNGTIELYTGPTTHPCNPARKLSLDPLFNSCPHFFQSVLKNHFSLQPRLIHSRGGYVLSEFGKPLHQHSVSVAVCGVSCSGNIENRCD